MTRVGLFNRIKDPVDAQFRLTSCSVGVSGAAFSNCHMSGVVTGPGIAPVAVEHESLLTPTSKWPSPGQTLPVTVDAGDPRKLRVRWDEMPTNRELARQYSEQQAAAQAAQQAAGSPSGAGAGAGAGTQAPSAAPTGVVGDPGRAVPGTATGGLTPEQSAAALAGGASGLGLVPATARVIAAHEVALPAGTPRPPGGVVDLTLDVSPSAGAGYSTVMRISFSTPEKRAAITRLGRDLPVLISLSARDQVVIDTTRLD